MKKLAASVTVWALFGTLAFAGSESFSSSGKEMKETAAVAPEEFSWTGFYLGLHLGYGWHEGNIHSELLPNDFFSIEPDSQDNDSDGITGGAQLGYNWQCGMFVLGAEADFSAAGINGESHPAIIFAPTILEASQTFDHEIDWFGTVRGRVGFTPLQRLLFYGTGGFAYAHIEQTAGAVVVPVANYVNTRSETELGWTAGAGIEYALNRHWSIKAEYLYIDVGDSSVTALPDDLDLAPYRVDYDWDNSFHSFTFGINYRF